MSEPNEQDLTPDVPTEPASQPGEEELEQVSGGCWEPPTFPWEPVPTFPDITIS